MPEAFFLVFRLESQGAKACKSCRSRQEFSISFSNQRATPTSIYLQNLASIQPRTSPVKFAVQHEGRVQVGPAARARPLRLGRRGGNRPRRLPGRSVIFPKHSRKKSQIVAKSAKKERSRAEIWDRFSPWPAFDPSPSPAISRGHLGDPFAHSRLEVAVPLG